MSYFLFIQKNNGLDKGESPLYFELLIILGSNVLSVTLATLMIFVFNAFFYMIIEPLIDKIGYHHKTDQNALVMFTVFVCLCADMIALPVIIGFNFEEHFDQQLIGEVFKGKYTDFSDEWFKDVGYQITLSIFIFALMPIVNQFVEF